MRDDQRYDGEVHSTAESIDDSHNVTSIAQARAATYFDRKEGFVPQRLAEDIARSDIIKFGHDHRLWLYQRGVYVPDGEHHVHIRVRELLGDKFRRQHADQVVAWFRAHPPVVGETEPRHLINCKNGLLHWKTGMLVPHDPEVRSTVQVPVSWNPDASCPLIERFLIEVLPDVASVNLMFEITGYCLLTEYPLHVVVLLLGAGANGKSTWLRVLRAFLGASNVSSVTVQALAENRFSAAQLHGKLGNLAGDLDARAIYRSDTLKMVTGDDPITAERKHQQPFEFTSYAVPIFSANEAPISSDQSEAWFRRWVIVPFDATFPPDRADPHLTDKLTTDRELEGLFLHAVAGLRRLIERGRFDLPEPVRHAGDRYRERLDTVGAFIDERCVVNPDAWTARPALYRDYQTWAKDGGRLPLANTTFYERVTTKLESRIEERTRKGTRGYAGIGLRTEGTDEP